MTPTALTGTTIKDLFRAIVDDTPDSTYEDNLLQQAKMLIEGERDWEILKKIDTTKTWATSDTYLTTKALPTDFFSPRSLYVENYRNPFIAVPLEHREQYKDISGRYYIDHGNAVYGLCGNTSEARTLTLVYTYMTDDIGASTSPVWPAPFHRLLPYYMAGLHQGGTDWDSISARMAPVNTSEAARIRRNMIEWDMRLKMHSMNARSQPTDVVYTGQDDVVDIDDL